MTQQMTKIDSHWSWPKTLQGESATTNDVVAAQLAWQNVTIGTTFCLLSRAKDQKKQSCENKLVLSLRLDGERRPGGEQNNKPTKHASIENPIHFLNVKKRFP